ncbi:hypothetical protein D9757_005443 [Collybiopsis confluens]|uniref:rRNA biogenesis protein RRP5 n=1 Tax=Collybiopsis confluens TaxID=2823264 RepID=A0A8H5M944_9AGAR|nr:hypothetical protein D9757_005443 [Collybiopsis confluens]
MYKKRSLDETPSTQKTKKPKTHSAPAVSALTTDDVDFPRGGGTSFTPLEVKSIRAEAMKEANEHLFNEPPVTKKSKKEGGKSSHSVGKSDRAARIEHLNYKRLRVGMKIFGQIVSIQPLAVIVSLPNQLFAHVPITNISPQLTSLLESMDVDDDEEAEDLEGDETSPRSKVPELSDLFHTGQCVRAIVTTLYEPGSTDAMGLVKSRDETTRASRRVELSLSPSQVNHGLQKSDLKTGYALTVSVKSVEDHGYLLDLGIPDVSGFLPFEESTTRIASKYHVGQLIDVTIASLSKNAKTCVVNTDRETALTEVSNISSVLPGALVQTLITAIHPTGFNLQVLGFFDGTVDEFHLPRKILEKTHKIGKKIKARVLYYLPSTPPRLALSLNEHIIARTWRQVDRNQSGTPLPMQEAYPVGTVVDDVKVLRVEAERGITVQLSSGMEGFVHISQVSDDHLLSLSNSGPWKPGSRHRARVLGYFPFDGLLQLSFKPSILVQKYLQVTDVLVGEIIKGTVKNLNASGLFVSLSGNIDGVVWPNHFADIALKNPAKRFRVGASVKCRVLVVDPERNRVSLTAKKSLIDSDLARVTSFEDAKVGMVTHGVVFKVLPKALMVEFYNNVKAVIPIKEVSSEEPVEKLSSLYSAGKVVQVRIITIKPEEKTIVASIRKSGTMYRAFNPDISSIDIGNIVEGALTEIHKENIVLSLQPDNIRALISINNLANHRGLSPAQLKAALKIDEKLEDLVVVSRNVEKNFVVVANKPKQKPSLAKNPISINTVEVGQSVGGRVVRHTAYGVLLKLPSHVGGLLHPTDVSDDFSSATAFPPVDSILKAVVVSVDRDKKQLTLSTRRSRMHPDQTSTAVVDREITEISDLHVGQTVRGFIKSVTDHGLFVTIGRNIDARVQIRELFDDFIKDWKSKFELHQLVKGRVLSADAETKKVELTLRSGDLMKPTLIGLSVGQHVEGVIKKIEEYGLFIQIDNSKLTGLCHKSEVKPLNTVKCGCKLTHPEQLSDNVNADTAVALRGFRENDHVRATVINIKANRISLSLKLSLLSEGDGQPETRSEDEEMEAEDEPSEDIEAEKEAPKDDSDPESSFDDDLEGATIDVQPQLSPSSSEHVTNGFKLSTTFQWFGGDIDIDEASSNELESSDQEQASRRKKKRKEIEQDLTAQMHSKTPESNADFERRLLGSPNSSYLWIQYMSFQLQLSETEKAREIGRRALGKINFREETEKLNVWIALLNLENAYGTDETLETLFKEATRANDSKTIHLRLASILDRSDNSKELSSHNLTPLQKAEEQYKRTCKKFGQSSKVWTLFAEYYLQRGDIEDARRLLSRALQSLEKRKRMPDALVYQRKTDETADLKTISRFAQFEYKLGEPERGKTLFEGIVDSHPKRWDMWSIYMDMEAGQSDIQSSRQVFVALPYGDFEPSFLRSLFDRVLRLKMTSHKAKSFFKKWLELERRIGDETGAEMVKQKAMEWTQKSNTLS